MFWRPFLDDIRSDLSVFHRVDDMACLPADRFAVYVPRLLAYDGALLRAVRAVAPTEASGRSQSAVTGQRPSLPRSAGRTRTGGPIPVVDASSPLARPMPSLGQEAPVIEVG